MTKNSRPFNVNLHHKLFSARLCMKLTGVHEIRLGHRSLPSDATLTTAEHKKLASSSSAKKWITYDVLKTDFRLIRPTSYAWNRKVSFFISYFNNKWLLVV